MNVGLRILLIIGSLLVVMISWYVRPYKALTWLFHDFLRWHRPDDSYDFDGVNFISHCRICGKEIMQDSMGNWFESEGE